MRLAFVFCVNDSLELSHDGDDAGFGGMDTGTISVQVHAFAKEAYLSISHEHGEP
jgi:hypothetical protein